MLTTASDRPRGLTALSGHSASLSQSQANETLCLPRNVGTSSCCRCVSTTALTSCCRIVSAGFSVARAIAP